MISTDYILSYIFLYVYSFIERKFFFSISTDMCMIESGQLLHQETKAGNSSCHLKRMGGILAVLC